MSAHQFYDIRDPIYGFVTINDWERDIINHSVFQRLRRIKQLACTDFVYPGANHTRFEHSIGVLHLASKAYDILTRNSKYLERLESELGYVKAGIDKDRHLVRLVALLHDIGHGPFSHAVESLMPNDPEKVKRGKSGNAAKYSHEQYSAAIIRYLLKDVIEGHKVNATNYGIKADDVADLLEGKYTNLGGRIFWRGFLTSQMDVDRMDYLLRDSYHCGVRYGQYDIDRLLSTLAITSPISDDQENGGGLTIGIDEGGWHAAEQLILARYSMFTQVYFHKTRRAYDHHLEQAIKHVVKGSFPPPDSEKSLMKYTD